MSEEGHKETSEKTGSMTYVIGIGVLVVACAGSFFGGMKYQESRQPVNVTGPPGLFGQGSGGSNSNGAGTNAGSFANGEVISRDEQSITIKLSEGGSKIVYFSDSTNIGKTASGTTADLKTGDQVVASGSTNADGSIAAQNIQIRPPGGADNPLGGQPSGTPPGN